MSKETISFLIALSVIVGFFVVVVVVLVGFVDIANPETAKLVGVIVGYLTALMNPVVMNFLVRANDD